MYTHEYSFILSRAAPAAAHCQPAVKKAVVLLSSRFFVAFPPWNRLEIYFIILKLFCNAYFPAFSADGKHCRKKVLTEHEFYLSIKKIYIR